jgi:4-amino-4-deoxy-L-arabinose transferase-like glycosyltransferase
MNRPRLPGAARARLSGLPRAALLCAVVACLNAVCWSIVTPFFQVSDEEDHFAYVQYLAEAGGLPRSIPNSPYSQEEDRALLDLHYFALRGSSEPHALAYRSEQRVLERDVGSGLSRLGPGDAGLANSEPPLYYALETIPYALGSGGSILVRMALMRLFSAVMAGFTALFVFLFLRELLPSTRWAWTVGGLCAALAPLLGSMSGAINPDALLAAVSAAAFYLLARGFHRGLTLGLSSAIGVLLALGFLTKLNFLGLAPGVLLGLLVLVRRALRNCGNAPYRWLAIALLMAFSPVLLYFLVNVFTGHPALGIVSGAFHASGGHGSLLREASYIWQRYLPRLPGMAADFRGVLPWRDVWFNGLVGFYGWDSIYFSDAVDHAALIVAAVVGCLCLGGLISGRTALRARLGELAVYIVMGGGVLALLGADGYLGFPGEIMEYRAPRYLLPMLALGCAISALAARGAGRRWGPAVGALIVVLSLAHDVFSQLLVISRFYG